MLETKDIFQKHIKRKIWIHSWILALVIYIGLLGLTYWLDKSFNFLTISKALAGTSALLLGISFSLSGFCYWWDFLDTKIGYRKQIGLAAYWLALAYSLSLLLVDQNKYLFHFFDNLFSADILLGTISMAIFTFLAIISTDKMMLRLGPKIWRQMLRLGYLAWVILALRAYFIEKTVWLEYLNSPEGFPPPRLLLTVFVIVVIIFRLSVDLSKKCVPFTNKKINPQKNER